MDGARFAKMLSDKHLFELKMSCIRLPFCTLLLHTTTPILTGMDALHGYSTSGSAGLSCGTVYAVFPIHR